MTLPPPRPANLESPTNRELLQAYLDISAKRLADTSPSYVDLFRKYIPAMAYDSTGLMEGILALAAIQIGLMRRDPRIAVDAASHYHKSLKSHFKAVADPNSRSEDSLLATSIILGHYEVFFPWLLLFRPVTYVPYHQDLEWRKCENGCSHVRRKGHNTCQRYRMLSLT